jgi:hypothetical protein
MADESTRAIPGNNPDGTFETELPLEEREQPDPALQMSTGRIGAAGVTVFAVVAVLILTVVLYGLNGPSETSSKTESQTGDAAASPNTSPAPTPTAPENGPGAKP